MRYVVCQSRGRDVSTIRITSDANEMVSGPHQVWALRTGRQIIAVELKLSRLLAKYHIGGGFDSRAMYGIEFSEMVLILTDLLGPSDRARYEALSKTRVAADTGTRFVMAAFLFQLLKTLVFVTWRGFVMLAIFLIVPIIIGLVRKHK